MQNPINNLNLHGFESTTYNSLLVHTFYVYVANMHYYFNLQVCLSLNHVSIRLLCLQADMKKIFQMRY